MHNFLQVADALVPYAWPLVVIALALVFRSPLREVLGRATGVTVLGQRIEFSVRIDDLRRASLLGAEVLSELPTSRESARILKLAARSPDVALIQVGESIDRELRLLGGAQGWLKDVEKEPLSEILNRMALESGRGIEVLRLIFSYADLRKYVDAARAGLKRRDERSAVEVSLRVLGLIEHIPREQHLVMEAGITLYKDAEGTTVDNALQGLRVRSINPAQQPKDYSERVLISRDKGFRKDMNVTWEWITEPEFAPHWYRDIETGLMRVADIQWQYVGRDLEALK